GVVDKRLRGIRLGEVPRVPTLDVVEKLVAQADVREGAADHHLVIASPGTVGVVVLPVDAVLVQVVTGRAVGLDGAGRTDVVGRDRVTQLRENPRTGDVGDRSRLQRHTVEVRGPAHVGGRVVPLEDSASRGRE